MTKSEAIFEQIVLKINDEEFKNRNKLASNNFSRNRIFNFSMIVVAMINRLTKSLNVELSKFLNAFNDGKHATKQAFSKARYKLKPEAFLELNNTLVKNYYKDKTHQLYNNEYLLLAVDGSEYELPWFDDILKEFGFWDNKQGTQPKAMATGVKIWDTLNRLTIDAKLGKYLDSEITMFDEMLSQTLRLLSTSQAAPILLVADAYFASMTRMVRLQQEGLDFVIRCKPTYCREVVDFLEGKDQERILRIDLVSDRNRRARFKEKGLTDYPPEIYVRAIRFTTHDRKEGCLLTSISTNKLSIEDIKEIYILRYGEEISFFFDKIKSQTENFATKKPIGVYQEWYANLLSMNMIQLLIEQAQLKLEKEQTPTPNKNIYSYRINCSVAIGLVKDEIPKVLLGLESVPQFNQRMIELIFKFKEPIRLRRTFERKKKHKLKYHMNQRKVL